MTPHQNKPSKLDEILQWTSYLTTEQSQDEGYFWTPQTRGLTNRLNKTKGNLMAVIGKQGVGKTKLQNELYIELNDNNREGRCETLLVKWDRKKSFDKIFYTSDFYCKYLIELLNNVDQEKRKYAIDHPVTKQMGKQGRKMIMEQTELFNQTNMERILISKIPEECILSSNIDNVGYETYNVLQTLINLRTIKKIERTFSQQKIENIKNNIHTERLKTIKTILIDTHDFNRNTTTALNKSLAELEDFWIKLEEYNYGVEEEQTVNLVIFFQKELWDLRPHFFCGKFREITLKPLTTKQLIEHYENVFESIYPFSEDALREIAVLSRGLPRRFKKYVGLCVEQIDDNTITRFSEKNNVSYNGDILNNNIIKKEKDNTSKKIFSKKEVIVLLSDVEKTITNNLLIKDFELELKNVFPKNQQLRIIAVKLIRILSKQTMVQSEISEKFFEGKKMDCSRFLVALENWDYIKRNYEMREKIVSLKVT